MAVTFGTIVTALGTGANTGASPSITTPATNPCVKVSVAVDSTTVTLDSLTITGFGGTASLCKEVRDSTAYCSVWKIVAPTANTAGTVQANFSASVNWQLMVETFSGSDQTDPMPTADAVTSVVESTSETLTPSNLTANDATSGSAASTVAANPGGINPNQRYTDSTTSVNAQSGDNTGTTGVTFTWDSGGNPRAKVAVRVKEQAAGGAAAARVPQSRPFPYTPGSPPGLR